ncbi:MAG TPA: hypothetical protein VF669_18385 [Tepidisphaeraceae bacterium]|jgi:hypothetical protein
MPTSRTLPDIAHEVSHRALPALFIDTCAALDVIRCAARNQPQVVPIVQQVVEATAHSELLLYGSSVLLEEAARNRTVVEGLARREAVRIDEAINVHRTTATALGVTYPHAPGFTHESIVPSLISLHDQLLNTCVHAVTDTTIQVAAFKRAGIRRRPAKGGGGVNDCLMFEEFRHVAHAAPDPKALILLTVNTEDFVDKDRPGRPIHSEISSDLAGTKARVCLSWPEAAAAVLSAARLARI